MAILFSDSTGSGSIFWCPMLHRDLKEDSINRIVRPLSLIPFSSFSHHCSCLISSLTLSYLLIIHPATFPQPIRRYYQKKKKPINKKTTRCFFIQKKKKSNLSTRNGKLSKIIDQQRLQSMQATSSNLIHMC